MSGFLVVARREGAPARLTPSLVEAFARQTDPDDIRPHNPLIHSDGDLTVVVMNPVAGLLYDRGCVCLGYLVDPSEPWARTGSTTPEGSYGIVRHDDALLQLVPDDVGSRTIWYVYDETYFAGSTSLRVLVTLLGSFEMERAAAAWMLSSGTLGPELSWDKRIRSLPPNSLLTLDRRTWKVTATKASRRFSPQRLPMAEHRRRLREAIIGSCAGPQLDDRWLVPLSGGVDSRAVLLGMLQAGRKPRCVTWGWPSHLNVPGNDATIAAEVARRLGVEHEFAELGLRPLRPRDALDRFLLAGEGRVESFGAYSDGMVMWRGFFERGLSGIVRGDEAFGWRPEASESEARRNVGAVRVVDYPEGHLVRSFDMPAQEWPEYLQRQAGESFTGYADRLSYDFECAVFFAPLTQVKSAYLEVASPLLARRVLRVVQEIPDGLRTDKMLLRQTVEALGPPVPFAEVGAFPGPGFLADDAFHREFSEELQSAHARDVLPPDALGSLVTRLGGQLKEGGIGRRVRLRAAAGKRLPPWPAAWLRAFVGSPVLGVEALAFRAYIVTRMATILADDARAGAVLARRRVG